MSGTAGSPAAAAPHSSTAQPGRTRRGLRGWLRAEPVAARLFVTVWLIYGAHFASDVARETYLAMSLGSRLSIRVDEYLGLHPDLFEVGGRGAYINNNPGASMLGAIPYAIARPFMEALFLWKPELRAPKPPTVYDDPRPNRNPFLNAVRERGLDIELGLAAASIHAGLMVPLGAASALIIFFFLRRTPGDERRALWLALLWAFGTPIFFRSAYLNQNVLIAYAVLLAYVIGAPLARADGPGEGALRRVGWLGFLMGFAILCDYSGAALALAFGLWVSWLGWRAAGVTGGFRWAARFIAGAAPPILLLFLYQWRAFGNPFLPAQTYMPDTSLSVSGWHGFVWPTPELFMRNLFDPGFGLIAFSPMFAAAVAAPFLRKRAGAPAREQLALIFGASAALLIFISSVQFAFLQWNTGIRYIVPAVPLLFMALVPVLLALPRWAMLSLIVPTVAISWSVAMTRDAVPSALARVFLHGFELPWLTVLRKTAAGYAPFLADGASPLGLFVLIAVVLWLVWRTTSPGMVRRDGDG
ncbi:MAG: DUF2079 domain-containing protein [Gemmatimonadetes bacterium]|nr:DUF2079 domain-containing protein [Gemmatimonadota bacterium]